MPIDFGLISPQRPAQPLNLEHPVIREWTFAREMFRRLGFAPDTLYISTSPVAGKDGVTDPNRCAVGLALRAQDKEFEWLIGWVDATMDRVAAYYEELVIAWNQASDGFALVGGFDAFASSWAMSHGVQVMLKLKAAGFALPRSMN